MVVVGRARRLEPAGEGRGEVRGDRHRHLVEQRLHPQPHRDEGGQLELAAQLRAAAVHRRGEVLEEDPVLREGERAAQAREEDEVRLELEPGVVEPARADEHRLLGGPGDVRLHRELPVGALQGRHEPGEEPEVGGPGGGQVELARRGARRRRG